MRHSYGYRAVSFVFRFSLFSFVLLCAALALARALFLPESLPAHSAGETGFTVVIDAGHGGRDGGAVADDDGTLEKDLNLAVAKKLAAMLRLARIEVVMTRETDIELASPDSSHKKRDDLTARLNMTKGLENAIFVSIHMNKYPVAKYSGLQVYYSEGNAHSLTLAEQIQKDSLVLNPGNSRGVKAAGDAIYLLSHMEIPAVLVECGFLSNYEEKELLKSEGYQMKLAASLFCSVLAYINENPI